MEKFLGTEFIWFVGVVEDRQDPQYAGRLRVRALGHHTSNKTDLPTVDLPWASVVLPTTASGISGLGQSPSFLVEGSWVWGYFRDGKFRQEPVVLGSLPGKPTSLAGSGGFYDPNGIYPKYKDEPDVNRLAVNLKDEDGGETNPALSLTLRRATRIEAVTTSGFTEASAADGSTMAGSLATTWSQPEIPFNAVYPYNHVFESESGHLQEFDDTSGAERYHLRHRTGTSTEIGPDGTQVDIIKNDHYTLVSNNAKALVTGNSEMSIDGHHKIYINKAGGLNNNYDIQVGENANINIQVDKGNINLVTTDGKINVNAGGDYNLKVGGNMNVLVEGSISETVEGNKTSNTTGAVIHRGQTIDLNP